jgi:hypothetical protein
MPKMLILRGNSGPYEDEQGDKHNYDQGALHEQAAKDYATRRNYTPVVLQVSGDPPKKGKRDVSPQTLQALDAFHADKEIRAFYGFSGGAFNIYWIIQSLKKDQDDLDRIDLLVVLGIDDDTPESWYRKDNYKGSHWELVFKHNPLKSDPFVPKKAKSSHMFGPESLLWDLDHPKKADPAKKKK